MLNNLDCLPPYGWCTFQPDHGKCGTTFGEWNWLRRNSVRVQQLLADPRYNCFYEANPKRDSLRVIFENRETLHLFWRVVELVKWVALSALTAVSSLFLLIDFYQGKELCQFFYAHHKTRWDRVIKGEERHLFDMSISHGRTHLATFIKKPRREFQQIVDSKGVKIMILGDLLCSAYYYGIPAVNERHTFIKDGECIAKGAPDTLYPPL